MIRRGFGLFYVLGRLAQQRGAAWVILALACVAQAALVAATASCAPAKGAADPTRAAVRRTIDSLAAATERAVRACEDRSVELAKGGDGMASDRLWRECLAAYKVARPALIGAAKGVDAWGDASRGDVVCGALRGGRAVLLMAAALDEAGVTLPPVLEDARASVSDLLPMGEAFACPKT